MSGSCRWARDVFEGLECRKQHAAGIFVTSMMISDHLHGKPDVKLKWENQVERSWFYDDEPASDFLLRANRFLREQMTHSISILQTPVRTQSYVAFMRMPTLAALLLFQYLNVRKLEEDASPAAGSSSSLFHGFRMFVSSSRRVFSLTETDVPARHAKKTVLQGLRCLSQLSAQAWELLGPMKTAGSYLLFGQSPILVHGWGCSLRRAPAHKPPLKSEAYRAMAWKANGRDWTTHLSRTTSNCGYRTSTRRKRVSSSEPRIQVEFRPWSGTF